MADALLSLGSWLALIGLAAGVISAVLMVPRSTRDIGASVLYAATFPLGGFVWLHSAVFLHGAWGWTGIALGVILGGVGVVPLAVVALLRSADWWMAGYVTAIALAPLLVRGIAVSLAELFASRRSGRLA